MSDMPREIDEKKLQEIFKRLDQNQQKRPADKFPNNSKGANSSRNKRRRIP
jgi:hypothetical protein